MKTTEKQNATKLLNDKNTSVVVAKEMDDDNRAIRISAGIRHRKETAERPGKDSKGKGKVKTNPQL